MTKEEQKKAVEKALTTPQQYTVDGESVTQRPVSDIILIDKYLNKRRITTKNAMRALGVAKISTPGTNEK